MGVDMLYCMVSTAFVLSATLLHDSEPLSLYLKWIKAIASTP